MGWTYRNPQLFPAVYRIAIRKAIETPGIPTILLEHKTFANAQSEAERFRYFRWCVKQDVSADTEMAMILLHHDLRCTVRSDGLGHILELVARRTKYSDFVELNPVLASEIIAGCQ